MKDRTEQRGAEAGLAKAGRLVAIVVTHNRPEQLSATLDALLNVPSTHLAAVLVVDNASGLATQQVLSDAQNPRLHVLTHDRNLGGAGGFETGMRLAMTELAPDWLLIMDDDARPAPEAISRFHALDLTDWDAVAAAVYMPDGSLCDLNRPTLNPFKRLPVLFQALSGRGREAFHLSDADYAKDRLRGVDGASFVGLFLSAELVTAVGYPDGRLFLYADDALYTLSMTAAGHRLAFAPQIRFVHDTGTYSLANPRIRPLWKVYYYHRNLTVLYRWAAGWLFWPVMAIYIPRWTWRVFHHSGERRVFLRLLRKGLSDGLRGRLTTSHAEVMQMATQVPQSCDSVAVRFPAVDDGTGAAATAPEPSEPARRPEHK